MTATGASRRNLRQFAGAWLVVFGALAARRFVQGGEWAGAAYAVLAGAVGLTGLVRPDAVRIVYLACMVLAAPVGRVVSEILMILMFYGVLTPVALVLKAVGRDALQRQVTKGPITYWTPKRMPEDVSRYLSQF